MYSTAISRLIACIFVLLISIPTLVLAQSTVNLTLDDGSMDEEFLGTGRFTVTRDGSTAGPINVFVELGGSATYNTDFTYQNLNGYAHPTWHVTIPAGQNSASVTLTPVKDNFNEGEETLTFELLASKPGNGDYIIGAQTTAEMALEDDVATVILTLDDGSMDEEFLGTGRFTVTRDDHGNKAGPINVFVELGGSATYNTDFTYQNLNGYAHPTWHVTIPAGQNSASVTLTPVKDNFNEGEETLTFELLASKPGNGDYIIGAQTTAEMALEDDVATVILTLDDGSMDEEFLGTGRFTVTRDDHGNKAGPINVFVELGGSAAYNTDFTYQNFNGYAHPIWHVTIPAGQNSASVTLTPVKDNFNEGEETLTFKLLASKPGNGDYIIGAQTTADMTLEDDVATVILTLDDGSMDEEFLGTGRFTVTRDDHGNKAGPINVFVELGGSAAYNVDFSYQNFNGYAHPIWHVTIPAGQNSASVTLTPVKDNFNEGEETLTFKLLASKPGNGDYIIGAQTTADMTLEDDVATVILTLEDGSMHEAKQDTAGFTVTRDDHGNKAGPINVFVELGGNAVYNIDFSYQNLNGYAHPTWHVTIPAGQNSNSVTLTAIRDLVIEGDETLIFTLLASKPGNGDYIVGAQTTAEITIIDLIDRIFSDSFEE